jgi:hypothetical protein
LRHSLFWIKIFSIGCHAELERLSLDVRDYLNWQLQCIEAVIRIMFFGVGTTARLSRERGL